MAPAAKKDKPAASKEKAAQPKAKKPAKPVLGRFDPYIGSKSVIGLDRYNFEEYLEEKDAALVMFYDPLGADSDWSKKHYIRAAKTTERVNHGYGATDCVKDIDLCKEQEVDEKLPVFKLYSRGHLIETYTDHRTFLYPTMKKYVENAPLVIAAKRPKRPCDEEEEDE